MDLLNRINELARISKQRPLTEEELEERKGLREEYIKNFRKGFKNTLLNTTVVDSMGNDVTPKKLKEEQLKNKKGDINW